MAEQDISTEVIKNLVIVSKAMDSLPEGVICEHTLRRKIGRELTKYVIGGRVMLDRREVAALIQRVD